MPLTVSRGVEMETRRRHSNDFSILEHSRWCLSNGDKGEPLPTLSPSFQLSTRWQLSKGLACNAVKEGVGL